MTRTLTLSLLTLITMSGLTMVHATPSPAAKDTVTRSITSLEQSSITQPAIDEQKGKGEVPRPKPTPGPREGNEE
jgi:hypothetical protein